MGLPPSRTSDILSFLVKAVLKIENSEDVLQAEMQLIPNR